MFLIVGFTLCFPSAEEMAERKAHIQCAKAAASKASEARSLLHLGGGSELPWVVPHGGSPASILSDHPLLWTHSARPHLS